MIIYLEQDRMGGLDMDLISRNQNNSIVLINTRFISKTKIVNSQNRYSNS